MHRPTALLAVILLALAPLAAGAARWDAQDVAAAEQYRERERARARRYRAEVAREGKRVPAPAASATEHRRQPEPAAPTRRDPSGWLREVWEIAAGLDVPALSEWMESAERVSARWQARLEPWLRLRARFEEFVESGPRWSLEPRDEH